MKTKRSEADYKVDKKLKLSDDSSGAGTSRDKKILKLLLAAEIKKSTKILCGALNSADKKLQMISEYYSAGIATPPSTVSPATATEEPDNSIIPYHDVPKKLSMIFLSIINYVRTRIKKGTLGRFKSLPHLKQFLVHLFLNPIKPGSRCDGLNERERNTVISLLNKYIPAANSLIYNWIDVEDL